jgi:hypothetical protein
MNTSDISNHLKEVQEFYRMLQRRTRHNDFSDIEPQLVAHFSSSCIHAIERAAGKGSVYYRQIEKLLNNADPRFENWIIPRIGGYLDAFIEVYEKGYLNTFQELIHADVFSDFLEMAEELLTKNYKDSSAVLIGGVLEEHLRKLCIKNSIEIERTDSKGNSLPKKAEAMNTDLYKQEVYTKIYQKSVTSWLDLRNNAAHGKYDEYSREQVRLMLMGVLDLIKKYPG